VSNDYKPKIVKTNADDPNYSLHRDISDQVINKALELHNSKELHIWVYMELLANCIGTLTYLQGVDINRTVDMVEKIVKVSHKLSRDEDKGLH
jgi:hypothetical protein